ncbi:MAG: adenylyl-sulfate kinase [Nitrospirae bacterium]|nr:adenylyl-sulfate kinase [Nitrospirota bacterium]
MSGMVIWITGLPGSGKSTIADAVKLKCPDFVILRMDDLRHMVTPQPAYSDDERELVYRSLVYVAKTLSDLGHEVIIDATGNMRRWRELARRMISPFAEVYLKCSFETCSQRERQRTETHGAPRGIYQKGLAGWPVPGLSAPYEEPSNPEIVIDAEKITAVAAAEQIIEFIERSRKNPASG